MTMSRYFGKHHGEVLATFNLLRETWSAVDKSSNVTLYPTSYHETFLDMARAVVAAKYPDDPDFHIIMPSVLVQPIVEDYLKSMAKT